MNLSSLKPAKGSVKKEKRLGRGQGSGKGGTSTKGHKGHQSRSGYKRKIGFEGGQMPLARRLPKRGFVNPFTKHFEAVNVSELEVFEDGSIVNAEALIAKGILSKASDGVKVLGNGELTKKLTVVAAAFSGTARQKIEAAGGKTEVV